MVDSYTQDTRLGELATPIGENKLVLSRFDGAEAMNEPFNFSVGAISETDNDIDFDKALGENVSVRITSINGQDRYFTGTLAEAVYLGEMNDGFLYSLTLRPWFWLLTKHVRSQVFHDMNVQLIVDQIFTDHGQQQNYVNKLERSYPTMEYCVQHQESDFDFVSRLLEAHGIGYFFEFEQDKQTMVLADVPMSYPAAPSTNRRVANDEFQGRDEERFYDWWPGRHFSTTTFERQDYDFRKPKANMRADSGGHVAYNDHTLKSYQYPYNQALGKNITPEEGKHYAEFAVDAEQVMDRTGIGWGDCATLAPGMRVMIEGHPTERAQQEYLILRADHYFFGNAYRGGESGETSYRGTFEAMSTRQGYAPLRKTPKPLVAGVQTGRVVGNDEEFETDEYGRVKVFFHWMNLDDDGALEGQSMWCRVAQVWSGPNWGGQFIPRKDMEVLVQFIGGDPDQPVVIGTVYNEDNKHPFEMPNEKYTSGWRSRSQSGTFDTYNEISMKDDSGEELLKFHAEKDLLTEAEHNEDRDIGQDRNTKIGNNDTHKIGQDLLVDAGQTITLQVGGSKIVIDNTSITLTTMTLKIDASHIDANATSLAELKSGGMVTIKGGFVGINS